MELSEWVTIGISVFFLIIFIGLIYINRTTANIVISVLISLIFIGIWGWNYIKDSWNFIKDKVKVKNFISNNKHGSIFTIANIVTIGVIIGLLVSHKYQIDNINLGGYSILFFVFFIYVLWKNYDDGNSKYLKLYLGLGFFILLLTISFWFQI